jgi:D-mannonate dehydratase
MAQTVHPGIRAKLVSATSLMRTWPMAYGYTEMGKLMNTLVDVDFRGNLIADHVPGMAGSRQAAWSYSMGYIRALHNSALALKKV